MILPNFLGKGKIKSQCLLSRTCLPVVLNNVICRYITQEGNKLEVTKTKVPTTVTNAVSWRSEGIKYKKNEIFIDVIESINVLVSNVTTLR